MGEKNMSKPLHKPNRYRCPICCLNYVQTHKQPCSDTCRALATRRSVRGLWWIEALKGGRVLSKPPVNYTHRSLEQESAA